MPRAAQLVPQQAVLTVRCAGGPPLIFLDEPCALDIPHSIVCEMAAMPAGQPPRGPPNGGPACLPRRSRWGQTCCSCGGGRGECTAEVSVSQVSRLWVGQGTAPWLLRHCCQPVVGHFHLSQQLKSGCCRQWMLLTIMGPGDQPRQIGLLPPQTPGLLWPRAPMAWFAWPAGYRRTCVVEASRAGWPDTWPPGAQAQGRGGRHGGVVGGVVGRGECRW